VIDFLVIALALLVSPGVGFLLHRRFRTWARWRIVMLGALPIPLVLWAICLALFVEAATASAESCGVDACGMTMMAAMAVAGMTLVVYLVSLPLAAVGAYIAGRRAAATSLVREFE